MELIIVVFMIAGGICLASVVIAAIAVAKREPSLSAAPRSAIPERDRIAASVLYELLLLGGEAEESAFRRVRTEGGILAPVTAGVDVSSWAETFARVASEPQREQLLEKAVKLVAARTGPVPLRQYSGLLDLSFGLGFQTSALAKLRDEYGFEYVDPARSGRARPREPLAQSAGALRSGEEQLQVLQVEGEATRPIIISAYRRLAAQHHPDRFHGRSPGERERAAARFIEITEAYEELLAYYRD